MPVVDPDPYQNENVVYVYGPTWCQWCQASVEILKQYNIPFKVTEPSTIQVFAHQPALSNTTRYPILFVGCDPMPLGGYKELCTWAGHQEEPPSAHVVQFPSRPQCRARCLQTQCPCSYHVQSGSLYYCTVHQRRARRSIPVIIYTHDPITPVDPEFASCAHENILDVYIVDHVHTVALTASTSLDHPWFPGSVVALQHHQQVLQNHKCTIIAGWENQTQTFEHLDTFQRWAKLARARIQCTVPECYFVSERDRGLCIQHLRSH